MHRYLLHNAAALLALSTIASAQQVIPTSATGSFPQCALNCAVLIQAQQICAATPGSQLSYEQCFCQSPGLGAIYQTPDAICAGECTVESDRQGLQTWFLSFCSQVGQNIDPNAIATQPAATVSTTVVTIISTSSSTAAATITGSGSSQSAASAKQESWIDGHWRWVLMIGILIVGLGLLAWLAIWLKKRHRRKLEEKRASASGFPTPSEKREGARSATPDLWGPHQHMHATKGWQYHAEPAGVISEDRHDSRRHKDRRSKRERSPRDPDMIEAESRPKASRQPSSKGKGKERVNTAGFVSGESSGGHGSRSRSHRRKERDRDKTQDRDIESGLRGLKDG